MFREEERNNRQRKEKKRPMMEKKKGNRVRRRIVKWTKETIKLKHAYMGRFSSRMWNKTQKERRAHE
jgi:hypothetical protein